MLETARLSEMFFEQLQKHSVPLEEAAIKAINNNSMALDLYCWLAYRLHVLTLPRPITWKALHAQFGGGFMRLDHFRSKFLENLALAMAVYPEAKVTTEVKGPDAASVSSACRSEGNRRIGTEIYFALIYGFPTKVQGCRTIGVAVGSQCDRLSSISPR